MSRIRAFSGECNPPARTLEDAPLPMRQEVLGALYETAAQYAAFDGPRLDVDRDLYMVVCGSIGPGEVAGNPMPSKRHRMSRDLTNCADWRRIFDLVIQLWPHFERANLQHTYRENLNRIFAGYGVAWDLGPDGHLHRVLPKPAEAQVVESFQELTEPRFRAALELATLAQQAYDDRPRRSRDACTNIFDTMEATAKIRFNMPNATFGHVVAHLRQQGALQPEIIAVLEALNSLRHKHFGHGMNVQFALTEPEVDLTYLSCIAGILLFVRMRGPA
jgi:hypothetical protein